jgi:hypothetical protein
MKTSFFVFLSSFIFLLGCFKKNDLYFQNGTYTIDIVLNYGIDSTEEIHSNSFVGSMNWKEGFTFYNLIDSNFVEVFINKNEPILHLSINNIDDWQYSGAQCNMKNMQEEKNFLECSFDTLISTNSLFSNGTISIKKN